MRMTRIRKRKANFKSLIMNFNHIVIVIMSLIFIAGVISGAYTLNNMPPAEFTSLLSRWSDFLNSNSSAAITDSIFKYGKTTFIMWLCGFFKYGFIIILLLIFAKGVSIGFTSSFIIKTTGNEGIFFVSKLYLIQTFILILLCFLIGICGTRLSLSKNSTSQKYDLKNYFILGIFQVIGILFLSLIDITL